MDSADEAVAGSSSQSPPEEHSPSKEKGDDESAAKKAAIRKRTKTGCLTCRKRRIKCDEGRPTCNNCIKSKRNCEGYNQRVIFKDPISAFAPFGSLVYPTPSPQALVREQQLSAAQQKQNSASLQIIAPKPPALGYHPGAVPQFSHAFPGQAGPVDASQLNFDPDAFGAQQILQTSSKFTFFPPETVDDFSQNQWQQGQDQEPELNFNHYQPNINEDGLGNISPTNSQQHDASRRNTVDANIEGGLSYQMKPELAEWEQPMSEEDASMGESEDELVSGRRDSQLELNEVGVIVSQPLNDRYDSFGTQARTFRVFAADNVLATYEPSPTNSPLRDKQVASVFWHFVNVTGPSISLYERHPFDPSPFFQHGPTPKARQHVWTYTFPILSFSHPALLQAILALGSLQIAKLQQVPPTASLKHYHLALRRIARNIGRPTKRAQPANLAATLLLAYYEVWNSDHEKWSKHLLGARWIIKDIPFHEMTRSMMAIKRRTRQRKVERMQRQQQHQQHQPLDPFSDGPFSVFGVFDDHQPDEMPEDESDPLYADWDLTDMSLLTRLTGKFVTYDDVGIVTEDDSGYRKKRNKFTEKDMETYEQLSDLFWWYCKMDVYQSILGGTRLFMDYDLWTQCPPRAPMGRLDAIYGTYDHLVLILGRLANFASRDVVRKRRIASKAGTFGPSGAPPGSFPGMMPAASRVPIPKGFSPRQEHEYSPKSDTLEDQDLDALTALALVEWEGIKAALEEMRLLFGPEFEPMPSDLFPASTTPFGGPPARFKTYSIAGMWMNYYMGMIVLHRSHPSMPPVAMMAAGRAAQDTGRYAMEIGRIAAGLEEHVPQLEEISTLVGAAFIESSFCLFVAGVQYQQTDQRNWLIQRLHDIARLTGWQSARQIADGCESAWVKASTLGRGPPYTRSSEIKVERLEIVWELPRRIDRRILELAEAEGEDHGKKLVLAKEEKAHYAMGLLSVEQDLERLDLDAGEGGLG